jgi:hypothetical protein
VVHTCPFKRVAIGYFDAVGVIITERSQKIRVTIEKYCDSDFLVTTEGLYIAPISRKNYEIINFAIKKYL